MLDELPFKRELLDHFIDDLIRSGFKARIKFDLIPKPDKKMPNQENIYFFLELAGEETALKERLYPVDLIFRTRMDNFRRCLKGMNWGSFTDSLFLRDLTLSGEISMIKRMESILKDYDKNHCFS